MYSGFSYVDSRLPAGTRAQPSSLPTSSSYSLLEAHSMNSAAESAFLVVLGIAQAQAQSQPADSVSFVGANA